MRQRVYYKNFGSFSDWIAGTQLEFGWTIIYKSVHWNFTLDINENSGSGIKRNGRNYLQGKVVIVLGENRKEVFFKAIGYRAEAENVYVRLQMNFPLAEEGMKNSRPVVKRTELSRGGI